MLFKLQRFKDIDGVENVPFIDLALARLVINTATKGEGPLLLLAILEA